jgi:hypothetical protein
VKFDIGEIAIIAWSENNPLCVGMECEIVATNVLTLKGTRDYKVYIEGYPSVDRDKCWAVMKNQLKKLGDPNQLSNWEVVELECGWKPILETEK